MKKNGFTLVELLSIVVILGIIVVVALPQISGSIGSKKEKQYNKIVKIVENAGKVYLTENGTMDSVSIDKLIKSDYLTSGLKNPINNTPLTGCVKKIISDGVTKYKYEVDNCPNYLATHIMDLYDNEETRIENGLKKDNTSDENIRYYGANPNNYVSFNNELWRIIGVFGNNVKLVRKDSLGSLLWDSSKFSADIDENSGAGINQWGESTYEDGSLYEGADLQVYLNKMYYGGDTTVTCYGASGNKTTTCPTNTLDETSKALIDNHTWNVGAVYSSDTLELYKTERGTKIGKTCQTSGNNSGGCSDKVIRTTLWTGHVALPYITDWAYASSESICETNVQAQDSSNDYICQNNNWINSDTNIWTLSPRDYSGPGGATYVRSIGGNGYIASFSSAAELYDIYPSIYLKSNVLIESGNGTSDNPYILKAGA